MSNLKDKSVIAVLWNSAGGVLMIGISLIFSIILARLLDPADFGVIAIIMVVYILSQEIIRFGLETAIIQKEVVSDEEYSISFFIMFALSTVFALLLYFSADWLGVFYQTESLAKISRIFSCLYFIDAIMHIQRIKLKKRLDFKRLNIFEISAKIIGGVIAVIMALKGFGLMSLVAQNLIIAAIQTVCICYYVNWWPSFNIKLSAIGDLFHFGKFVLVSDFVYHISQRFDSLIVGKYFDMNLLGLYDKGKNLSEMGQRLPANMMMKPLFTSLSSLQHDDNGLERMINRIYTSLSFIFIPFLLFLVFNGTPLIRFVYGEKWVEAGPYFSLFCVLGVFYLIRIPTNYLLLAIGKVEITFRIEMFVNILKIVAILILARINLVWMIYTLIGIRILEGIIYFMYCNKHLLFNTEKYIKIIMTYMLTSLVLLSLIYYGLQELHILNDFAYIMLYATTFSSLYLILNYILKLEGLQFHWDLAKRYLLKKHA